MLADLVIPGGVGGVEAVRRIRELGGATCCVAMSGYSNDRVMARPRDYGFDAGIGKPFAPRRLLSLIARLAREGRAGQLESI